MLEKFNLAGFRLINDLAGHNFWLDRFMIFVADKMGYLMILGVLFLVYKNSKPTFSTDRQYDRGWGWCGARAGWAYLALAGLMGIARIFVSVHWPLDILAGAVLGMAPTFGVNYLKQKMPRRAFKG